MKVINLFAGPSAGKSTTAAGVFSLLKLHGISIELSTEYAKDVTHKEAFKILKDQVYVFGKQQHKTFIVKDKYKYLVTDSPILLSIVYCNPLDREFIDFVLHSFKTQDNLNYLIKRVKPYVSVGRNQNEKEAMLLDTKIQLVLENNDIPFKIVRGDYNGINTIVDDILALENQETEYRIV